MRRVDHAGRISGIGLRGPHVAEALANPPSVAFLEVHAENHMGRGRGFQTLCAARRDNAVSIHGVGLSLGGAAAPDTLHLKRFAELVREIEPILVSEHLAWSRAGGVFLNDLIPVRYDDEALASAARNIDRVQAAIGRTLLVENPSHYFAYRDVMIAEAQFIEALCRKTGCGVLLDVNNIVVSAHNVGFDAAAWIDAIPPDIVGEIHLAGYEADDDLLIDTHGAPVSEETWALYRRAVARFGPRPTLIERDTNLPTLAALVAEAYQADATARHAEAVDAAA